MTGPLWLDGVPLSVRDAAFTITFPDPQRPFLDVFGTERLPDERDVLYGLRIEVDEQSGEDGAPFPEAQRIPVLRLLGRLAAPEELDGLDLSPPAVTDEDWDAALGNDAAPLMGHRMRLGPWEGGALRVRWEARAAWAGQPLLPDREEPGPDPGLFLFSGPARFEGIACSARDPDAAEAFLRQHWGEAVLASLERTEHRAELPPGWNVPERERTTRVTWRMRR